MYSEELHTLCTYTDLHPQSVSDDNFLNSLMAILIKYLDLDEITMSS